jgi:hypothetical protein
MKKTIYVGVNIDWSKSFVDENGGFYAGTSDESKHLTAKLMPYMDLVINTTDFHSIKSLEFAINGGMWPLHNVAEYKAIKPEDYGLKPGTTISPEQTRIIDEAVNKRKTGIVVPRHVYFQDGVYQNITPEMVEDAFGERIITSKDFVEKDFTYIIAPKTHFDATTVVSEYSMPADEIERVPQREYTVFDLIERKFPKSEYEVVYVNTGVVDNICRHYTSTGERQKFGRRVVNIIGATTELYGIGLGFEDKHQVRDACQRIQTDIGIEHKTLEDMIKEIEEDRK